MLNEVARQIGDTPYRGIVRICIWFVLDATVAPPPQGGRASSFTRFIDHTRRTTVGRTPLGEWSARRRDSTWQHKAHNRRTSMTVLWDTSPQFQQASGCRTTPLTARSLGPAVRICVADTNERRDTGNPCELPLKRILFRNNRSNFDVHKAVIDKGDWWILLAKCYRAQYRETCELVVNFQSNAGLSRPP